MLVIKTRTQTFVVFIHDVHVCAQELPLESGPSIPEKPAYSTIENLK